MPKILVVEDDLQVRDMLRDNLLLEGYEVFEAGDGNEALEQFKQTPCDLVIMDIVMPGKDGIEAIYSLTQKHGPIKIIAISGGNPNLRGEHLLKTASKLGAAKTFSKPVDMEELLKTIADMLGQAQVSSS